MQNRISMNSSSNYIFCLNNEALEQVVESHHTQTPETISHAGLEPPSCPPIDEACTLTQHRYSLQALEQVLESLKHSLSNTPRDTEPETWASLLQDQGIVLAALGQHRHDPALLTEAVDALEQALETTRATRDDQSAEATIQTHLGAALLAQGLLEQDIQPLKRAADAYTEALKALSRDEAPFDWAAAMHNLGIVFHAQGKLLKGHRMFEKSVAAYKNALAAWSLEDTPKQWAMSQNNRGAALQNLAEREQNPGRMEEAIRAYEKTLKLWLEQVLPMHMAARTTLNLAISRIHLAELARDRTAAELAIDDLTRVTEIYHATCGPDYLALGQQQMDRATALFNELADTPAT